MAATYIAFLLTFICISLTWTQCSSQRCLCGVNKYGNRESRVVGGEVVRENEYPWRVALFSNRRQVWKQVCGGTLISPNIVMTAAHCLHPSQAWFSDRVSVTKLWAAVGFTNITDLGVTQTIQVSKYIYHKGFQNGLGVWSSYQNDIALLVLERPVMLSESVQLACLPFPYRGAKFTNSSVTAAGWGKQMQGGPNVQYMNAVTLPIVPYEECWRKFFFTVGWLISTSQFCAYDYGKDTCQGDSGSGMEVRGLDNRFYTVGIVSWGFGCARWAQPGIYTKVPDYLDWIVEQTHKISGEQRDKLNLEATDAARRRGLYSDGL